MKAPAKDVVRLGNGNVYVGNPNERAAVNIAADTKALSWGWGEGSQIIDDLRRLDDYLVLSQFGFEDRRDANDCPMMIRKGLHVRHFSMTQVCDDAEPEKLAHDRTFSMLAFEAPMLGEVNRRPAVLCHIAIHPNWVTGFENPSAPIVKEYVRSVEALDSMLTLVRTMGWLPVVGGDFNSRETQDKRFLTVFDVFEEHRLRVQTEGLDGQAWDRRLRQVDWHVIPKTQTRSDHPWVVGDYKRVA